MSALWTQNSFAGTAAADITTVSPSFPTSPAGSYSYVSGSGILLDGNGNIDCPTGTGEVQMVNWAAPGGNVFTVAMDLWHQTIGTTIGYYYKIGNSGSTAYVIYVQSNTSDFTIALYKLVSGTLGSALQSATYGITANNTKALATVNLSVTVDASVGGTVSITAKAGTNGGGQTQQWTNTDSSSALGISYQGFAIVGGDASFRIGSIVVDTSGTTPLSVGNLGGIVVTGQFAASITCPTPTGGVGSPPSYSYVWYQSTTTNFTLGSGNLSGVTTATLSLTGLTPNSNLWVACRVSDGTTSVDTPKRLVRVAGLPDEVIGVIGDSTSVIAGGGVDTTKFAPTQMGYSLGMRLGLRKVTVNNRAIAGTGTQDWQGGGTNMNNAITSFGSAKLDALVLRLGANDAQGAVSSGTFTTQYANILSTLIAASIWKTIPRILVDYPTWREPGIDFESPGTTFDETTTPFLLAYLPIIAASVDNVNVFAGDWQSFYVSACQPDFYLDMGGADFGAIHPSFFGAAFMGQFDANAVMPIMNPMLPVSVRTDSVSNVVVSWVEDPTATDYQVFRTSTKLADSTLLATVAPGTLSYTDTSPLAGRSFYQVVPVH